MTLDIHITLGELLIFAATIVAPLLATLIILHRQNVIKMNELLTVLQQFPLHIHVNGKILYPAGTAPRIV